MITKDLGKRNIYITGRLDEQSNHEIIEFLTTIFNEEDKSKPITMYINSYGGDALYPLIIYELINSYIATPKIITINMGYCESAGLTLFLIGDERKAYSSSIFMAHSLSVDASTLPLDSIVNYTETVSSTIKNKTIKMISNRTKLTKAKLNKIFNSGINKYITGEEAKKLNICTNLCIGAL